MKYVKHTREWPMRQGMVGRDCQVVCKACCVVGEYLHYEYQSAVWCKKATFMLPDGQAMDFLAGKCDHCGALNLIGNPFVLRNVVEMLKSKEVKT